MIEDFSESKYNISCDQCGHEISDELIKKNQDQNKPLYCELCGAQINLKSSEKEEVSKRKGKGEIITQHEEKEVRFSYTTKELRQEIINYVYQKTYELLKTTPFVIRRLKQQKDMKHFQKIKLAKKLQRILLSTSLPTHGLEQLTKISQKKIENYFDNFKSALKTKQKFQPKIHPRIIENIEFIYRLINGDFELSTLSRVNQRAVKDLLRKQGFKSNIKTKNSFSYQLSLFLCSQIYKKITTQGHVSKLLPNKNQLTKHYISSIAKDMMSLILNNLLKRRFSRRYRTLKENLELDWVYRESLINHICSLVKFIYKLTYNIRDKSKLNGFERLIAEDLKRSKFFENDECFTPYFRLNLILILCRIIHKITQDTPEIPQTISNHSNLNPSIKQKILEYILNEIATQKKINYEFLEKFYKLMLEEFQTTYEKFQTKLTNDMIYYYNFMDYVEKLIKIVYTITHSASEKSKLSKFEQVIIKDLANYNFRWNPERESSYYFYSDRKEKRTTIKEIEKKEFQDIFTKEIAEDDPLWRVRSYILGFILADGYIQLKDNKGNLKPMLIIEQHKKDKDILLTIEKAVGGSMKAKKENYLIFSCYNRKIIEKVIELGMVKGHTKKEIATNILPPEFIKRKINKVSLVRDFVRGYYEGDGTFSMNKDHIHLGFSIIGPSKFLKEIKKLIESEIPNITTYVYPYKVKIIEISGKKYRLYGKNKIYIKGKGLIELENDVLINSNIIQKIHPWLIYLIVRGRLNCIKLFNWLYEENDKFDGFSISGFKICGKRKFQKALQGIGKKEERQFKISPDWKDVIYNVIPLLESRFYSLREMQAVINQKLKELLTDLNLDKFYEEKAQYDIDNLARRLKFVEFEENLIESFYKREGRYNQRYYCSRINPPSKISSEYYKEVNLISKHGTFLKNLKNLIIFLYLIENQWRTFDEIKRQINEFNVFGKTVMKPYNVKLFVQELCNFEILIKDNEIKDVEKQCFILNKSILPVMYNKPINTIKDHLVKSFIKSKIKKKNSI